MQRVAWDYRFLGYWFIGLREWCECNSGCIHIVNCVVALEDWLSEQEEVVVVLANQDDAS